MAAENPCRGCPRPCCQLFFLAESFTGAPEPDLSNFPYIELVDFQEPVKGPNGQIYPVPRFTCKNFQDGECSIHPDKIGLPDTRPPFCANTKIIPGCPCDPKVKNPKPHHHH